MSNCVFNSTADTPDSCKTDWIFMQSCSVQHGGSRTTCNMPSP